MSSDRINKMLVDSVHLEFGQKTVLQSAFITSETGKVTGLFGRNGAGKSCLFRCIMGGIKAQNLSVRFNDEMDTDYGNIGKRVKYLPQGLFMPARMTLGEAFDLYHVDYDGLVSFDVRFLNKQGKRFHELSGGEARLAEIYLVLRSASEFCLLDEPFSNIAPKDVEKIQDLILAEKKRKGIIVSDHMYEALLPVSDELFLLKDGYTFPIQTKSDLIKHGYII